AAIVYGSPNTGGVELLLNASGVLELTVGNRQNGRLHGGQPHGERASVMLDEDSEEALDGTVQRPMHHQRLMRLTVFSDVLQPEARRQIEIELDRGELPFAADRIDQLYVDFRPVERGFVRRYFDLEIQLVRRSLEGILRKLPLIGRARVFPARSAVPGG